MAWWRVIPVAKLNGLGIWMLYKRSENAKINNNNENNNIHGQVPIVGFVINDFFLYYIKRMIIYRVAQIIAWMGFWQDWEDFFVGSSTSEMVLDA